MLELFKGKQVNSFVAKNDEEVRPCGMDSRRAIWNDARVSSTGCRQGQAACRDENKDEVSCQRETILRRGDS